MASESAKELGKKIIGYPEERVPVVSVKDWTSQFSNSRGVQPVRLFSLLERFMHCD